MSLLDDLADYLSSGSTGLSGTILRGRLSDTPAEQLAIAEYGGLGLIRAMSSGPGTALLERPRVQILSRSTIYANAKSRIKEAENLLDGLANRTINGTVYHWIEAIQSPFLLQYDSLERPILAQNFEIIKARSTA